MASSLFGYAETFEAKVPPLSGRFRLLRTPQFINTECRRRYPVDSDEVWCWAVPDELVAPFLAAYDDVDWEEIPLDAVWEADGRPDQVTGREIDAVDWRQLDRWLTAREVPFRSEPPRVPFDPTRHCVRLVGWAHCGLRDPDEPCWSDGKGRWPQFGQTCSGQVAWFDTPYACIAWLEDTKRRFMKVHEARKEED